jgi:hypothetical protein
MITDEQIQEVVATLSPTQRSFMAELLSDPFNEEVNERLLLTLWRKRCQ